MSCKCPLTSLVDKFHLWTTNNNVVPASRNTNLWCTEIFPFSKCCRLEQTKTAMLSFAPHALARAWTYSLHLEEDTAERRPPPQHIQVFLVVLEANKAGDRVDELHVWQISLALEIIEEWRVLVSEVLPQRSWAHQANQNQSSKTNTTVYANI